MNYEIPSVAAMIVLERTARIARPVHRSNCSSIFMHDPTASEETTSSQELLRPAVAIISRMSKKNATTGNRLRKPSSKPVLVKSQKAKALLVTTKSPAKRATASVGPRAASTATTAFFKAYLKTGEVVDLYGSAWFDSALKSGALAMSAKNFAATDSTRRESLPGHFLLLALDPYRPETKAALKSTWKVMSKIIDAPADSGFGTKHNPDFIAFNCHTGHTVAFGLGRKARAFLQAIDPDGKLSETNVEDFLAKPSPFKAKLIADDIAAVIPFLLAQFALMSEGYGEFGPLPVFPEDAKARLRRKKDSDYSKKELKEFYTIGTRAETVIDKAEAHFRSIFKDCKLLSWEINPEDY